MPDPMTPVAANRPAEPLVYRPISGLAIAGLVFAGLYAGLALFSVVIAFLKREPFFLPSWTLLLAAAGVILSFLALRQIRSAEGTRAGGLLARWALWVSLLCGLGSATFATFTGLAVYQQADRFLRDKGADSGFFPRLQDRDVNAAFLLTVLPGARRQTNPNNDAEMEKFFDLPVDEKTPKGRLAFFRQADFVRLLQQPYDTPAQVSPSGVRSWDYTAKGYQIERVYRITNPEGEFDLTLKVQSVDGETPGEGRKWMVLWGPGQKELETVRLTALGERMKALRNSAAAFANAWLAKLNSGSLFSIHLDFLPPSERKPHYGFHIAQLQGAGAATLAVVPCAPRPLLLASLWGGASLLPGLHGGTLKPGASVVEDTHLQVRGGDPSVPAQIHALFSRLERTVKPLTPLPVRIEPQDAKKALWQIKDGRLEMSLHVELPIGLPPDDPQDRFMMAGSLIVAADANADATSLSPDALWRVVRLELHRAQPIQAGGGKGRP